MSRIVATAFWRRIDVEGHDACRLIRVPDGWRLSGSAIFEEDGKACILDYSVESDSEWRTHSARVNGSVGLECLTFEITRSPDGEWLLNGVEQPASKGCIDLDLGFTPATNLIAIRRLNPRQGVEVPTPAAYYLEFTSNLGLLEQTYRRTANDKLHYSSPAFGYGETLTVSEIGFVTDYPGLWTGTVTTA